MDANSWGSSRCLCHVAHRWGAPLARSSPPLLDLRMLYRHHHQRQHQHQRQHHDPAIRLRLIQRQVLLLQSTPRRIRPRKSGHSRAPPSPRPELCQLQCNRRTLQRLARVQLMATRVVLTPRSKARPRVWLRPLQRCRHQPWTPRRLPQVNRRPPSRRRCHRQDRASTPSHPCRGMTAPPRTQVHTPWVLPRHLCRRRWRSGQAGTSTPSLAHERFSVRRPTSGRCGRGVSVASATRLRCWQTRRPCQPAFSRAASALHTSVQPRSRRTLVVAA